MATGNVDYNAVLADLEARKTQIDSAIAAVKTILASAGVLTNGSSEGVIRPEDIPSHAFLSLSIADATKKFLSMVKRKQSLPQIMQALERGGLPPAKYNTVYAVLRRREGQAGDIFRMGEDWALTEWYPNNPNLTKRAEPKKAAKKRRKAKKRTTITVTPVPTTGLGKSAQGPTLTDLAERILKESGKSMSVDAMLPKMAELGRTPLKQNLANALRKDPKKRFKESGGEFDLAS